MIIFLILFFIVYMSYRLCYKFYDKKYSEMFNQGFCKECDNGYISIIKYKEDEKNNTFYLGCSNCMYHEKIDNRLFKNTDFIKYRIFEYDSAIHNKKILSEYETIDDFIISSYSYSDICEKQNEIKKEIDSDEIINKIKNRWYDFRDFSYVESHYNSFDTNKKNGLEN